MFHEFLTLIPRVVYHAVLLISRRTLGDKVKLTIFAVLINILLTTIGVCEEQPIEVAFGATTSVVPAMRQEYVYRGFKLALEHHLKDRKLLDRNLAQILESQRKSAPITLINRLLENNAKIVFGFSSSHEALLAAPMVVKKEALLITSASHDSLSSFGPNVHSIGVSISQVANTLSKKITAMDLKDSKGLLIEKIDSVFSVSFSDQITREMPNLIRCNLMNGSLDRRCIDTLKKGELNFLVLSMYPEEASELMQLLNRGKVRIPIFTNHTWSTADPILVRGHLSEYQESIFTLGYYAPGSQEALIFEQLAKKTYGSVILTDMACGWDFGTIASHLVNSSHGRSISIEKYFRDNKCYEGTTSGKICFAEKGGFADRKLHFLRYDKKMGFRVADEKLQN